MSQDFDDEMDKAHFDCSVQVGDTQVLPSDVGTFDAVGQAGGQEPNMELENMREEAEFLYQDNQKTQQKLVQGQAEMEELKNRIAVLEADLLNSEQRRLIEKCHFDREIQKEHDIVKNSKKQIEDLKQLVAVQSIENARLKEELGKYDTMECKYKKAVGELANKREELAIMEAIVKDHTQCAEKLTTLEYEKTELLDRSSEQTEAIRKLCDENSKLKEELQFVQQLFDMKDVQCRSQMAQIQKLERKLQILQGGTSATRVVNPSTPRFELRKSYLPECGRCKSCLVGDASVKEECKYHPSKPLPYRSWVRMFPESTIAGTSSKNMYWPCCKQFSTIEPEGCASHPNHTIQNPVHGQVLARACI